MRAEHIHRSERGELRIRFAASSVVVFTYVGHADASCIDFVESVFETMFGSDTAAQLRFYVDCEEQTGYDAAFRDSVVALPKRIQPQSCCILVRSPSVAFGVAVANARSGTHMTTLTDRAAFEAQLQSAVNGSASRMT